jgi:hypothetical protein
MLDAITITGVAGIVEAEDIVLPPTAWTAVDLAAAAALLDVPIRRIPGLPIRSVEAGSLLGEPAVRVVQWSGSVSVELIQSKTSVLARLAADSGAAAALPNAEAETARAATALIRDGTMVLLRAPLPRDSLELLARRIP